MLIVFFLTTQILLCLPFHQCTQKACDLGKALEETSVEPAKQATTDCTQKACDLGKALEETSVEPAKQATTDVCLINWS
ncbi:hypothetical protein EGR_10318 [Echinococcus granulosus]|uniref:Uncharacterized protein n=1 Tax=Echinococcus granulosus TaxID=6210 RepID=W6U1B9_ECHGR|nr:hypothetical protein EGR_10318 [Echinococcus granulosus]EUB54833.1 hypothetical protein EGR_10318 [Echinococcus granulosus]